MPRNHPATLDPNGADYGLNPETDPGHTHTAASVSGVGPTGVFTSPSVTTGTAFQCSTTAAAQLYITVNTSATLAVSMGPTNATADAVVVAEAVALSNITLVVPKGWWVKLTGTIADLTISQIV